MPGLMKRFFRGSQAPEGPKEEPITHVVVTGGPEPLSLDIRELARMIKDTGEAFWAISILALTQQEDPEKREEELLFVLWSNHYLFVEDPRLSEVMKKVFEAKGITEFPKGVTLTPARKLFQQLVLETLDAA